jgi:hypothetical protein
MFCWPYITVYQYNETNMMHFLFSLLRIKGLYIFRALLAHLQEALHKRHLIYSTPVLVKLNDITRTQYTNFRFCSASWGWVSNARNVQRWRCRWRWSSPVTGLNWPRGWIELWLYPFMTSALEVDGWSAPRPGRFTPGKDPVRIVQEAGWALGPVWTCAKNLAPTGIGFSP